MEYVFDFNDFCNIWIQIDNLMYVRLQDLIGWWNYQLTDACIFMQYMELAGLADGKKNLKAFKIKSCLT